MNLNLALEKPQETTNLPDDLFRFTNSFLCLNNLTFELVVKLATLLDRGNSTPRNGENGEWVNVCLLPKPTTRQPP
jgi:hypothetical protein